MQETKLAVLSFKDFIDRGLLIDKLMEKIKPTVLKENGFENA